MQNIRLSKNEQGIIGIIAVIAFVVGLVFLRDILVKRGVRIAMLTESDYINAAEYYMQKKYGEKFEGEYIVEDSIYVHPKANPQWHAVVEIENDGIMTSFHDNYVGYLKKEELEKYIYELVKPIYGECKVYTQPYDFPNDDIIEKNTDIFTYAKKANYVIHIFVSSNIEDRDKDFDSICNILVNDKMYCSRLVVTYISKEDLNALNEIDVDKLFYTKKFYMRLTAVYNRRVNEFDGEVYEVEGEYDYGK